MAENLDWGIWTPQQRWLGQEETVIPVVCASHSLARAIALNITHERQEGEYRARNIHTGEYAREFGVDVDENTRRAAKHACDSFQRGIEAALGGASSESPWIIGCTATYAFEFGHAYGLNLREEWQCRPK